MANFGTLENNSFLYDDFTGSLQVIAEPSGCCGLCFQSYWSLLLNCLCS